MVRACRRRCHRSPGVRRLAAAWPGWVTIWREQRGYYDSYGYWRNTSCVVVYDGRGSGTGPDGYPYGFYVWDVDDPAKLTAPPRVTITLPYRVTWSYGTGNTDWKLVSSSGTTYVFEYQGSYTVGTLNGKPTVYLSGRPHFRGTVAGACPQDNSQTIERCAQVNGKDLCFPRNVPFPTQWVQAYGAQNVQPMSAEDAAPELDETPAASESAETDAEEAAPQKEEVISSEKALT